jgi:dihydropyrimidine dehydrogenase (NAD+) subunit PreA
VKPIALHLVSSAAKKVKIPIIGIGGIGNWIDAAEHIALGASTVQVCTAAMHYGFRIVEDMADGLSSYMDDHGYRSTDDFRGRAVANVLDWGDLDLNYKIVAKIHTNLCIGCQLCYVACEDGAHQCIERSSKNGNGKHNVNGMEVHVPRIIEEECVGCNLCALVCPVEGCITMQQVDNGLPPMSWKQKMAGAADPSPAARHTRENVSRKLAGRAGAANSPEARARNRSTSA